ncbi:MAG: 4Fe-4S dicluster domain-containing protein [Thermoguttaceae bacterium]|nr:4Fe-4S dicluster domain-containing protein [Thermoguttaceae bacterium]
MAVCPTEGLLPQLSFARLDAAFAPQLVPRQGPCLPDCTACGEACSTGAIARISAEEKAAAPIGLAEIDHSRCLPWASGDRCTICLDACPPEYRAIELRRTGPGEFRPFVVESSCTGCGVCGHRCPLDGAAAIRVVTVPGGPSEFSRHTG